MSETGEIDTEIIAADSPEQSKKRSSGVRRSVEVNGHTWQYIEYGNPKGIPIINVHGWLDSSAEGNERLALSLAGEAQDSPGLQELTKNSPETARGLAQKVQRLQGKYHILTPELPGFGATKPLDGSKISLDQIADALADFQKAVTKDKAVVFGSSMGGILAIKMAARHPESAQVIVIQGTMTQPKDMDRLAYVLAQIATWGPVPGILETLHMTKKLFATIVSGSKDFKIADQPTQERIISATFKADSQTAASTLREIGKNIGHDIDRVRCPVVIIDGVNGDLVPIMKSHDITKRFYPGLSLPEKVPQRVVFLPIGGSAGEQGHNLINTLPEGIASWIDYTINRLSEKGKLSELAYQPQAK
ncbi:alpha/beta hydrolase [Candidatus Daviesbacteria bacterium]|nr:alpha/beta hydrolase [Candidatus Daviesbacteria bacterium]